MNDWTLGWLSKPHELPEPLEVPYEESTYFLQALKMMCLIRAVERQLADGKKNSVIGGPVHLGVGQEAIPVGVSGSLKKTDMVFSAHRSHAHVLSLGSDIRRLFAEILGKETGLSKGMGGSMHIWDEPNGFYGSVPIVAGTVPLAVGAGIAANLQSRNDIAVSYLGDGAIEEGVVHESLNLAKISKARVLFVVENNLFASHMHISLRQPKESVSRFADANDIPYEIVDGNNIVAIHRRAKNMIAQIRNGKGPGFIEAITYRWYGHVDWRDDIDVGVNRSIEDVKAWKKRDPISRLSAALINIGACSGDDVEEIKQLTDEQISKAWEKALTDPYPEKESLMNRVYFDREKTA